MKMRIALSALFIAACLSGCMSFTKPLSTDKSFPPDGRYEVLGPIACTGKIFNIIGIITIGDIGYADLYAEARRKLYADDVVNISTDVNLLSILGIYSRAEYILRGTAIKYINPPANAEGWPE